MILFSKEVSKVDTVLGKIKENTDKYVLILSQILKVNVEIIDDNCNVISSTENINTYSKNEAYVYKHVIANGGEENYIRAGE